MAIKEQVSKLLIAIMMNWAPLPMCDDRVRVLNEK